MWLRGGVPTLVGLLSALVVGTTTAKAWAWQRLSRGVAAVKQEVSAKLQGIWAPRFLKLGLLLLTPILFIASLFPQVPGTATAQPTQPSDLMTIAGEPGPAAFELVTSQTSAGETPNQLVGLSVEQIHAKTLELAMLILQETRPDLYDFLVEHDIDVSFERPGSFTDTRIAPKRGVLGGGTKIVLSGKVGFDPGPAAVELTRAAAVAREGDFHEWNQRPLVGPWISTRSHYPFFKPVFGDLDRPAREAGHDVLDGFRGALEHIKANDKSRDLYDDFYSDRFEEIYNVQQGFTGEFELEFTEERLIQNDVDVMESLVTEDPPLGGTINGRAPISSYLSDIIKVVLFTGLVVGLWRLIRGLSRIRAERAGLTRLRGERRGTYGASGPRVAAQPVPGVRHIVAVASNKGGVGKTTTAVSLALELSRLGYRVGLMDADLTGPNIPTMLGIPSGTQADTGLAIIERDGVRVVSTGFVLKEGVAALWGGPLIGAGVRQLLHELPWGEGGELDYLIMDLPPGTSDASISAAEATPIDGAVIVTTGAAVAVEDAKKAVRMFRDLDVPIFGLIRNKSYLEGAGGERYYLFGRGGGPRVADQLRLDFLGDVPFEGAPVMKRAPDSPASQAIREIAKKLVATTSGALEEERPEEAPSPTRGAVVESVTRSLVSGARTFTRRVGAVLGAVRKGQIAVWEWALDRVYESPLEHVLTRRTRSEDLAGAWPQERKNLWELGRVLAWAWPVFLMTWFVEAIALSTGQLGLIIGLLTASGATLASSYAWIELFKRRAPDVLQEDPLAAVFTGDPTDVFAIVAAQRLTPIFHGSVDKGTVSYIWDSEGGRARPKVWIQGVIAAMQQIVRAPTTEEALAAFQMAGSTIEATIRGERSRAKRETLFLHWVYLSAFLSRYSASLGGVQELADASVKQLRALANVQGMEEDFAAGQEARFPKFHVALEVALADAYLGRYETAGSARDPQDLRSARAYWQRARAFLNPKDRHYWVHAEYQQMTLRLPQVLHDAWVRRGEAIVGSDGLDDPAALNGERLRILALIADRLDKLASVAIWGTPEIEALLDTEPPMWRVASEEFQEDLRTWQERLTVDTWEELLAQRPELAGAVGTLLQILRDRRESLEGLAVEGPGGVREHQPIEGVRHIIAVASNKGGVGKSTVAVNLALQLRDLGYRVGLVDADLTGPNIPTMLGVPSGTQADTGLAIVESHGIRWASNGLRLKPGSAAVLRGTQIATGVCQLLHELPWGEAGELDYLIMDLPPGTSDASISAAEATRIDGVVIVTTGADVAVQDATRAVIMFDKLQVPIFGLLENMSYFKAPDGKVYDLYGRGGGREAADRLFGREDDREPSEGSRPSFLGETPFDYSPDRPASVPIVQWDPNAPAAQAIRKIADQIVAKTSGQEFSEPPAGDEPGARGEAPAAEDEPDATTRRRQRG